MKHENDGDTSCNWHARYTNQRIGTGTGGLGNKRTSGDDLNYRIVEIDQNNKTSPGDLRRLTITQIQVEIHPQMLVRKARKIIIIIKGDGRVWNQRSCQDHPNKGIVKIGQHTEKSSEILRRYAVIQIQVKVHLLILARKTHKEW